MPCGSILKDTRTCARKVLKVPKFGNDDDFVDQMMAWLMHNFSREVTQHKNIAGGHLLPLQIPLAGYVGTGKVVGALPSGRLAWEPFSDGISPTRGSDVNGPTAVLKSVGKMNNAEVCFGQTLNMRIDPDNVQGQIRFQAYGGFAAGIRGSENPPYSVQYCLFRDTAPSAKGTAPIQGFAGESVRVRRLLHPLAQGPFRTVLSPGRNTGCDHDV